MAASKDMGLVPSQRLDNNGLNSQLLFPDDSLRFNCGSATHQRRVGGDPGPKTRELTGFIEDKMFGVDREERYFHPPQASEYRRSMYGNAPERRDCPESQDWNGNGSTRTPSGSDGSEEDDDDEEDDEDDVEEGGNGEVEGLLIMNCNIINNNNSNSNGSGSAHSSGAADKIGNDAAAAAVRSHSSFGSNRQVMMKDGNIVQSANNNTRESPGKNHQQLQASHYQNANVIAEPDGDMYYPQFIHGSEGSSLGQKDIVMENGRKDISFFSEPGNSLKTILSDPLTGALMDDAMILPCGHSFGGGGIQHVLKMKACYTCSHSILEESVQPNLSLRAAVMAFRREEKLRSHRTSKRRREKFEDKGIFGDSSLVDASRGRGVQFPFAVTDRVVIKGNKRTPERFVGREAVVTTQCLNGWYVVKTLDNAESVKLQYRSLAKVADSPSSNKPMSNKMTPNWL